MFHDGYWTGGSKNSFTKEEIDGFIDERLRTVYSILPNTIPDLEQSIGSGGTIDPVALDALLQQNYSLRTTTIPTLQNCMLVAPRPYNYYIPVEIGGDRENITTTDVGVNNDDEAVTIPDLDMEVRNPGEAPNFICIAKHLNSVVIFDAGSAAGATTGTYTIPVNVVASYITGTMNGYSTAVDIHVYNRCHQMTVQVVASSTLVTVGSKKYAFDLVKKHSIYDSVKPGGYGIIRFMYENRAINGVEEVIPVILYGDFTAY